MREKGKHWKEGEEVSKEVSKELKQKKRKEERKKWEEKSSSQRNRIYNIQMRSKASFNFKIFLLLGLSGEGVAVGIEEGEDGEEGEEETEEEKGLKKLKK